MSDSSAWELRDMLGAFNLPNYLISKLDKSHDPSESTIGSLFTLSLKNSGYYIYFPFSQRNSKYLSLRTFPQ